MSNNILFDNIIITDNLEDADAWAKATYSLKRHQINKDSVSTEMIWSYASNWENIMEIKIF